ncbi:hypothetical protein HJFPF1_01510 [Paramyrothecium foliicola]|nr:hypothetical protein HJFPF1_01510 [Paramyrothecium foliicola]
MWQNELSVRVDAARAAVQSGMARTKPLHGSASSQDDPPTAWLRCLHDDDDDDDDDDDGPAGKEAGLDGGLESSPSLATQGLKLCRNPKIGLLKASENLWECIRLLH